jgi:hypothetical protein
VKITLEPTEESFRSDEGFPVRVWRGHTCTGIAVIAFIAAVTVPEDTDREAFERELRSIPGPNTAAVAMRPSFTCPNCGVTSHNPNDAEHRYCICCHRFFNADGTPELG